MNPREIEKLLGGYATDTLTEEERSTLFAAAMDNQALFDALADEQALRELLQDPASRAQLMAALGAQRISLGERITAWLRRPSVLALAGAVAAGIVLIAVVQPGKRMPQSARPATVAMSKPPQPPEVQAPAPSPAAAPIPEGAPESRVAKQVESKPPAPRQVIREDKKETDREHETLQAQNAPARAAVPKAEPAPPPPPATAAPQPQAFVPPAQPMLSLRDANQAPAPGGAPPRPAEAATESAATGGPAPAQMRKAAAVASARELYYAGQPEAANKLADQKSTTKQKSAGRGFSAGTVGGIMTRRSTAAPAAAPLPGIRYSIQQRGADGSYAEVDPSSRIGVGAAVRLRLEANQEGTLTVARRDADGTARPANEVHLRAGEPVYLPADSPVTLAAPGDLHFQVKFVPAAQPPVMTDQLAAGDSPRRDQVGTSVYVVNPQRTGTGVEFEIVVKAQ